MIKNKKKYTVYDIHNIGKSMFGFWLYLMSDGILFATMFAVYCVTSINVTFNINFFNLKISFLETVLLLLSSIFCGIFVISAKYKNFFLIYFFLFLTFICGLCFIIMEYYEFYHLISLGYIPQKNGFLSSFFSLIGMHGIHVIFGLFWILGLSFHIHKLYFSNTIYTRILCFSLFWHFLDIIWICIFTVVYLMGNIS
uniref:cytochrome c oxidase subunit 3 n=1 Tax=Buchnera aphidicola TaxID=9 RepID=UPI003F5D0950